MNMDGEIGNCFECGRVIASDATQDLCDVCFVQYDRDFGMIQDAISIHRCNRSDEIAEQTRMPIKRIEHILEHEQLLTNQDESDKTCSKCKSKPALVGFQHCLGCKLAMFKSLGDEANQAASNSIPAFQKPDSSLQSLKNAMDAKRSRAGFNRYKPNASVKNQRGR